MHMAGLNNLHRDKIKSDGAVWCHETALSHCVHPEAALTHAVPVAVGGSERATCNDIGSGISASAFMHRGLRQPSHGLPGRPCATAQHQRPRWVADPCNPSAGEHLWHHAVMSTYTNAPSGVVDISIRSSHLVGDSLYDFGTTVVASACSLC